MDSTKTSRRWWWLFAVCIAAPALGLSLLGLRTVNLEQMERRAQTEQQQSQTELLADERIADRLLQLDRETPAGALRFTLDASGALLFPRERIYFGDAGAELAEGRATVSGSLAGLADEALAAEAQGDFARASELCRTMATDPRLAGWAGLILARIKAHDHPEDFLNWTQSLRPGDLDALAPDGQPVMLIASGQIRGQPAAWADRSRPFVAASLTELRRGRWWLSFEQRKLWDAELSGILAAAGQEPAADPLLAEAADVAGIVRRAAPFPRDGQARLYAHAGAASYLVVVSGRSGSGTALADRSLPAFFKQSMDQIRRNIAYPVALLDASGQVLWGDPAAKAGRRFPLRTVNGWELRSGEPSAAIPGRRMVWYAFLAFLLLTLAFGIAVTVRTVRQEMHLVRLQNEFAASVTHEFKSPITGIRLLMERILSGRVSNRSTMEEYYAAVCRETDRLELLVNRLLETHRIQSGQAQYQFSRHPLAELAQAAVARLRPQADAKHIALTFESDDLLREVELDRTAIQDSIENLIENAIKYSAPGTQVDIAVEHSAAEVCVTVRDQGVGIHPADLPRIFTRFYRGRQDEQQSVRGTGLGLPLVKAVAEGHGGSVRVSSTPGRGSEFRLRIPIREEKELCPKP